MLYVKTPEEVLDLIHKEFTGIADTELVELSSAIGRVLAEDIASEEYVPDFNRSTVDGYAVHARDTFGCSEAIPAMLPVVDEVLMGQSADFVLNTDECCIVPTGGALPEGADSVVMLEYTENYGDGLIGIAKSAAPGDNVIFRGDDVYPGKVILKKGRVLSAQDIGALAAIGKFCVPVRKKLRAGIISTGDELVQIDEKPKNGQVRDVNSHMLAAMLEAFGVHAVNYGIVIDDRVLLSEKMAQAVTECDMVLISGGSSVGVKDATCSMIESMGELLVHGIAMKPGKPTILGKIQNKPVFGLPGHPVAAYFVAKLFVLPLAAVLTERTMIQYTVTAVLSESISANQGRAQYQCCHLERQGSSIVAYPIRSKSGLITTLAGADGYFCIDRDCEGLPKGAQVQIVVSIGE